MNFSQIPGQKETIDRLLRSVKEERVSHALLFAGPEGCGGFALALAYARYISCENRSDSDSCGACKSCLKYDKLIHPDLHFVFPVIKGKKTQEPISDNYIEEWREMVLRSPFFTLTGWLDSLETGNLQGTIYTAEASEIIRKLSLKAFESDFKIMIIWLPEKMFPYTANKLLKMIEEPPEKTVFILVSEEPGKIIPTILSRCQLIKIPAFSTAETENFLRSRCGVSAEKAADLARVSMGNLSKASELCQDEERHKANLERFRQLMRFAWKKDVLSLLTWTDEIAGFERETQKNFLSYALRLMRENLMLTLQQKQNNLVFLSAEESDFSGKFHPFITHDNIGRLSDEFNLAHAHIEANGNARIVFLDLSLKIARLIR